MSTVVLPLAAQKRVLLRAPDDQARDDMNNPPRPPKGKRKRPAGKAKRPKYLLGERFVLEAEEIKVTVGCAIIV
jgi:hypothetical protein